MASINPNALKNRRLSRSLYALPTQQTLTGGWKKQFNLLPRIESDHRLLTVTNDPLSDRLKQIYNEALCSSQRTLAYCNRSEQVAVITAVTLGEQNEKLGHIEHSLMVINRELGRVERGLDQLKRNRRCGGCCIEPVKSTTTSLSTNLRKKKKKRCKFCGLRRGKRRSDLSASSSSTSSSESVYSNLNRASNKFHKIREVSVGDGKDAGAAFSGSNMLVHQQMVNDNLRDVEIKLANMQCMAASLGAAMQKQNEQLAAVDRVADESLGKAGHVDKLGRRIVSTKCTIL
jgi:hypothetical protein